MTRIDGPAPRIPPGSRAEIGTVNALIAAVIARGGGTSTPPHVFTTLARHRRLFRPWLRFASRLMPGGTLPRADSELVILRVAHRCDCAYEWHHHERIGRAAGLSPGAIDAARGPGEGAGAELTARQALLLRAVDELHDTRTISDETWDELAAHLDETALIELPMLAGHYEMLAMTLNSLRVQPDPAPLGGGIAGAAMTVLRRLTVVVVVSALAAAAGSVATPARAAALSDGSGLRLIAQRHIDGRLLAVTMRTAALPQPVDVRILLPPGYARSHRRYPVLYLLHGTSGRAADWTTLGDAERTTAGLPVIVVMPDIGLDGNGGGWCTDWPDGAQRWEQFHIGQLLPWVDAHLRTVTGRRGRAIAGLSQGGFCSTSYAARHPDLFSMALSYSGAPDIAFDPDAHLGAITIINATETALDRVPANSFFGSPVTDEINWAAHDPATLAENLRATRLSLLFGNGSAGPLDPPGLNPGAAGIEALVSQDAQDFHRRLVSLGIPSVFAPYGPGTHSWPYWARDLRWTIGSVMANFAHPPPTPTAVTFTSADDRYAVYGWTVSTHRLAREFSTLGHASCRGLALAGSGSATVTSPVCLAPRQAYRATIRGPNGTALVRGRATAGGRWTDRHRARAVEPLPAGHRPGDARRYRRSQRERAGDARGKETSCAAS